MTAPRVVDELQRLERVADHDDMLADRAAKKHLSDSERFYQGRAAATREIVRLARVSLVGPVGTTEEPAP